MRLIEQFTYHPSLPWELHQCFQTAAQAPFKKPPTVLPEFDLSSPLPSKAVPEVWPRNPNVVQAHPGFTHGLNAVCTPTVLLGCRGKGQSLRHRCAGIAGRHSTARAAHSPPRGSLYSPKALSLALRPARRGGPAPQPPPPEGDSPARPRRDAPRPPGALGEPAGSPLGALSPPGTVRSPLGAARSRPEPARGRPEPWARPGPPWARPEPARSAPRAPVPAGASPAAPPSPGPAPPPRDRPASGAHAHGQTPPCSARGHRFESRPWRLLWGSVRALGELRSDGEWGRDPPRFASFYMQ